jgi:hypothetical protein
MSILSKNEICHFLMCIVYRVQYYSAPVRGVPERFSLDNASLGWCVRAQSIPYGYGGVGLFWVVLGWDWRRGGRAYFIRSICRVRWANLGFLRVSVVIVHCLYVVQGQVTSVWGTSSKGHLVQGTHCPKKNVRSWTHRHYIAKSII